jgi:hypothetical protein
LVIAYVIGAFASLIARATLLPPSSGKQDLKSNIVGASSLWTSGYISPSLCIQQWITMDSKMINIALRGAQVCTAVTWRGDLDLTHLQFLWTLLAMALIGASIGGKAGDSPAILNYDIFCTVFAMLYLLGYAFPQTFLGFEFPAIVTIVLEALNVLFLFLAGIITAALLGADDCNNPVWLLVVDRIEGGTKGS